MPTVDAWGGSWGTSWGTSWTYTTGTDPNAFACGVFDPTAFDTNCQSSPEGRGNWNLNKLNAPKKPKRIKFSDFESRDAFEAAFRREITIIPMEDIPDGNIVEDDDDAILLMALTRILH